jgi:hypothetical protein
MYIALGIMWQTFRLVHHHNTNQKKREDTVCKLGNDMLCVKMELNVKETSVCNMCRYNLHTHAHIGLSYLY